MLQGIPIYIDAKRCSLIKNMIEEQWAAMPAVFKLDGPLSSCRQGPVELDFLVSAKLNFTHVRFLLELHTALPISHPSIELLQASAEMLSLVVEAIVMRQKLANSGTSLVWKVCSSPYRVQNLKLA